MNLLGYSVTLNLGALRVRVEFRIDQESDDATRDLRSATEV